MKVIASHHGKCMGFSRLSGGDKLELRQTVEIRYRYETDSAIGTKCGTQGKF